MQTYVKNRIFASPGSPPIPRLARSNFRPQQIRISIVCARKRRQPFSNRRSTKLILNAALTVAANLNILPPPVTALIREFGGGSGGGFGSRRGGGGGGFGWWSRRSRNLGFVLLVVVCGLGLCAGENGQSQNDALWCCLGLALVVGVIGFWNVRAGDWGLGFCTCVGLVVLLGMRRENVSKLGMRRENVTKLVQRFRTFVLGLGMMKMIGGPKSRRAF